MEGVTKCVFIFFPSMFFFCVEFVKIKFQSSFLLSLLYMEFLFLTFWWSFWKTLVTCVTEWNVRVLDLSVFKFIIIIITEILFCIDIAIWTKKNESYHKASCSHQVSVRSFMTDMPLHIQILTPDSIKSLLCLFCCLSDWIWLLCWILSS